MARLIDADALLYYFRNEHHESEVIEAVKDAPTIDAVPVVRCKDCKHHEHYDALLYCDHIRGLGGSVSPNAFCSYGERRTDVQLTD